MRRNPIRKKSALLLAVLVALITLIAGTTAAFLITDTDWLTNVFSPSKVSCEIVENFDGLTKRDVQIQNTGKTDAYIRATVVVTWMSENQNEVTAATPVPGTDYTITYSSSGGWIQGRDGYWYYTQPVKANGGLTETLVENCTVVDGRAPDGFYLSVEIVASAIQSSPTQVVEDEWNVTVSAGSISPE